MKTRRTFAQSERGAALIVALIFLLALTLLGTSGTLNSTMQERMASNTRNRDLAFEAAEHALTEADKWIRTQSAAALSAAAASTSTSDGVRDNGDLHANDLAFWTTTFDWSSTDLKSPSLSGVATQPSYVVEQMPSGRCPGKPTATCSFYRVTAQGVGAVAEAVVILQTMYAI